MGSYGNEYKETLEIIKHLDTQDFEKIPIEYINYLQENCNKEHNFVYDSSKSFAEQDMLEGTKLLLFELFAKFGTTEVQKQKIRKFKTIYLGKEEEEKRKRYNPDDVFKKNIERINKHYAPIIEKPEEQQVIVIKHKASLWSKLLKLFRIKK